MKIAQFASEVAPYAKTGGLADVAGALPKFLARRGHEVKVVLPLYRDVRAKGLPLVKAAETSLDWQGRLEPLAVWEYSETEAPAYFVERDGYFDRECLYGTPAGDYPDNGERFAFFARAGLEALKALGFAPDVLHVHDWQASPAPVYLKHVLSRDPFFAGWRTVLTVHNLAYQGLFDPAVIAKTGFPERFFTPGGFEFFGRVNYLKGGIVTADAVTTVSPTYSREIRDPAYGSGLDGLLRESSAKLHGILNGVDYADWDPFVDPRLAVRYSPSDLSGKAVCKKDLLEAFGLPEAAKDKPLIGMVSRLAGQKGLDLLVQALAGIFSMGARIVILGTGEAAIQDDLLAARRRFPSYLGLKIGFDETLAHKVYAGSDVFLIPSRYEPCGLTQMYSLKYGAIPVVRATGGLEDTIQEATPDGKGTGFKFAAPEPGDLLTGVRRALKAYADTCLWDKLVRNAMAADFSWDRSAGEYEKLYENIAAGRA